MQNYVMIQDPAMLQVLQAQAPSMAMDFESLQNLQNLDDEDLMQLRLLSAARRSQIKSNLGKVGRFALKAAPLAALAFWLTIDIHYYCVLVYLTNI